MSYYNTNNLKGKDLDKAKEKALTQDERIMQYFLSHENALCTPYEVQGYVFGNKAPVTSVRRSLTNLTKEGKLEKTNLMRNGLYGDPNYCWKLADNLKPQMDLFKDNSNDKATR